MEYIIKVSNSEGCLIDVRSTYSDLLDYAKRHVQAGYTIIDCYQMEGISKLQESLKPNKISGAFVLPQYESRNADVLEMVKNNIGASSIKEQVLNDINMEKQVQTIVCPNCGASATNSHNCEYCGSYLVQRAALGIDVTRYVEAASKYSNKGVEAALKLYSDILQEHPEDNHIKFSAPHVFIEPKYSDENEPHTGFTIELHSMALDYQGVLGKFKNSPLIEVFQSINCPATDADGNYAENVQYVLDFGYDAEGASKVVLQLMEIFGIKVDEASYTIEDGAIQTIEQLNDIAGVDNQTLKAHGIVLSDIDMRDTCVVFNNNGVIIEDYADYKNSGWAGILAKRQRNRDKLDAAFGKPGEKKKKKGCAGMLAFLLAAGIGSTYGVIELVKSILA